MDAAGEGLRSFFEATLERMTVMALVCGHERLSGFQRRGLRTWKKDLAHLTGIENTGVEKTGIEYTAIEYAGVEDTGVEETGIEYAGAEDARDGRNQ